MVINVSGYVTFDAGIGSTAYIAVWAVKNGNDGDRYGYTNISPSSDIPSISFNFTLILQPSDTYTIHVWQESGSNVNVNGSNVPGARIVSTIIGAYPQTFGLKSPFTKK